MLREKLQSEFGLIEQLSLSMLASHGIELPQYSYVAQNHKQVVAFLQELESRIDLMQTSHYFRAGRAYLTVNHSMGKAGNLFFKSVFDNLLKECKEKPHVVSDEKSVCVIFRI